MPMISIFLLSASGQPAHEGELFEIMNLIIFLKIYIYGLRCAMKFQKK